MSENETPGPWIARAMWVFILLFLVALFTISIMKQFEADAKLMKGVVIQDAADLVRVREWGERLPK